MLKLLGLREHLELKKRWGRIPEDLGLRPTFFLKVQKHV